MRKQFTVFQLTEQEREALADKLVLGTAKRSSGCVEWVHGAVTAGYGEIRTKARGRQAYTHGVSYELFVGPIPNGLMVLHECDNPSCIKPAHLFAGTSLDNVRDCMTKGRALKRGLIGEANSSAKLDATQVKEIRLRHAAGGISQRGLAREYGVIQATIKEILQRKIWRHV
jgi:hypothetical protein